MSLLFRSLSYQDVWGSGGTWDSPYGGPDIVAGGLQLAPVYAATSLIADLVATAPVSVFRRDSSGGVRIPNQPKLVRSASPYGSQVTWWHQAMTSLLLRGNAYGYVLEVDRQGTPATVIWFNPDDVAVIEEQYDWYHWPTYYWRGHLLDRSLVVHVPAYVVGGSWLGKSPLGLFKMVIESGMRAQQYGVEWFKHGANPAGMLRNVQRTLAPGQADVAKRRFKASIANHDVFVTGADWDYKTLAVTADEAQFLQTIKANAQTVAAIYRVPPEDIGGEAASTTLTYKTLQQDSAKLVQRNISTWFSRFESEFNPRLPGTQYLRFDRDALQRGDVTARMVAHLQALQAGVETLPEARAAEDRPALTDEQIANWQEWYMKAGGTSLLAPGAKVGGSAVGVGSDAEA